MKKKQQNEYSNRSGYSADKKACIRRNEQQAGTIECETCRTATDISVSIPDSERLSYERVTNLTWIGTKKCPSCGLWKTMTGEVIICLLLYYARTASYWLSTDVNPCFRAKKYPLRARDRAGQWLWDGMSSGKIIPVVTLIVQQVNRNNSAGEY
ncbi:hypothetical protein C3N85_21935 [Salmonella enterica subsp. enterica serovar Morehead]|nr:hypothetical protein [Salmonella enterica subsp. enterica serovar Morehead]EHN5888778.1 hypothetical protein [Salmonella enterica subsp. enterica serovar Newport]